MRYVLALLAVLLLPGKFTAAQDRNVGIGTLSPDINALLELNSDEKGLLIPRLTLAERNTNLSALGPAQEGLLIYNVDSDKYNYWDGTQWIAFPGAGGGSGSTGPTGPTGPIGPTGPAGQTGPTGPAGPTGADGNDGSTTLFTSTPESPGANCTNGGQLVQSGVDVNGNGLLEVGEITDVFFLCNGTGGGSGGVTGPTGPTGPPGPTVVSSDADNAAVLGSDGYIFVPLSAGTTDADWYESGTSAAPDNINDDIFTQGNVGIGTSFPSLRLVVSNSGSLTGLTSFGLISTLAGGTLTSMSNTLTYNGSGGNAEAALNSLGGTGSGNLSALRNFINSTGSGNKTLINNSIPVSAGPGDKLGISNGITSTDGQIIGLNNFLGGSANAAQSVYGTYNHLWQGSGNLFGHYVWINANGNGTHYGMEIDLQGNGNGDQYAVRAGNINTGTGNKYGFYSTISNTAPGTHYGVYSSATKANSFAGYFLGNLYIGTNVANGYRMPATDGAANFILQTDGSGQANWVDPATLPGGGGADNDWLISGNDVYKSVGTATIGTATLAGYPLNVVNANTSRRSVNIAHDFSGTTETNAMNIIANNTAASGTGIIRGAYVQAEKLAGSGSSGEVNGGYFWGINRYGGGAFSEAFGVRAYGNKYSGTSGDAYGIWTEGFNENGGAVYGIFALASGGSGVQQAGFFAGNVTVTGTFTNPSDERLKRMVAPAASALEDLMKLNVQTYEYQTEQFRHMHLPKGLQTGFIAQEVAAIYPELVTTTKMPGVDGGRESGASSEAYEFLGINYIGLVPRLVKAIQEQQEEILKKDQIILEIMKRLEALEERMEGLDE